ncbi:DUF2515 family protein [Metabacillus mangrovi]|nr:DUF2515 family protein [Metabacillus mangrovi]
MNTFESEIIRIVSRKTERANYDNISRTNAYLQYYRRNPEIMWSFLASMVSRNAGYNMTDLHSPCFVSALKSELRDQLFMAYEDANWLIFSDAYPQLLIYEESRKTGIPLFKLLSAWRVSPFMIKEWEGFFAAQDQERLLTSLIINEQHLIDRPILRHPVFRRAVFTSFVYRFQDMFHFSTVLFPTLKGELHGYSVSGFKNKNTRIELGKKLGRLLLKSRCSSEFYLFARAVPHTGARFDYEQFFPDRRVPQTPILRMLYPAVCHHIDDYKRDWFHGEDLSRYYFNEEQDGRSELTDWFRRKRNQLQLFSTLKEYARVQKKAGK